MRYIVNISATRYYTDNELKIFSDNIETLVISRRIVNLIFNKYHISSKSLHAVIQKSKNLLESATGIKLDQLDNNLVKYCCYQGTSGIHWRLASETIAFVLIVYELDEWSSSAPCSSRIIVGNPSAIEHLNKKCAINLLRGKH